MWLRKCLFACLILAALCSCASAARLTWDANTESDLAGYKIHYGLGAGLYTNSVDVGNVTEWQIPAEWPRDQSYYFAATAYDSGANESGYSNEAVYFADVPPPEQATNVQFAWQEVTQTMTTIGPIAIAVNNDDGELYTVDGGGTLYSGESNEIWMGNWGSGLPTYGFFRIVLPSAIPAGATINAGTKLSIFGSSTPTWDTGSDCLEVLGEQSADAPQASGTAPPTLTSTIIRWPASGGLTWLTGGNVNEVDIASIIQELVNDYSGLASGAHIQLWVRGKSTNADFHNVTGVDYNYGNPSFYSSVTIVYTSGGVTSSITISLLKANFNHMLVR